MTEQGTPGSQSLAVSAPGKLVLWGEYAVLVGARAGVLAVDRFARCQATTTEACSPIRRQAAEVMLNTIRMCV